MRADMLFAQTVGELAADALDQTSRVDEDERRAVALDELDQAVIDQRPRLVRHHALERRRRYLDREIALARVTGVDDGAFGAGFALGVGADEEARHLFDRLLRGGQTDAQQRMRHERGETFERDREMRAALVGRERVDFIDDDRARGRQHRATGFGAEQDVERLGRGDDDVRRTLARGVRGRTAACRRCAPRS